MKILLLGGDGQLGFELQRSLSPVADLAIANQFGKLPGNFDCIAVDFLQPQRLHELIEREKPHWIVNAVAYTAVDQAEQEKELALKINAEAVKQIGLAAKTTGARVLHYSTDYVFAGDSETPYAEDAACAPINHYGHSKWLGEQALIDAGCSAFIFRTAWVYGRRGKNFLLTMLRLAKERDQLQIVADQFGSPTPARLLADVSAQAIAQCQSDPSLAPNATEIFHVTASGRASWYGFAEKIFDDALNAGFIERKPQLLPLTTSQYPTPARRPAYSVLDNSKIQQRFELILPDWELLLMQVIGELA